MSVRPLVSGLLSAALVVLAATGANAQTVTITPGPGFNQLATQTNISDLEARLEEEVRALYGLLDLQTYLRLSSEAQSLVSSGAGADYASNPTGFFFGFSVNTAIAASEEDLNAAEFDADREVPLSAGAQLSLLLGYNFSEQGLPWLTASVHGMYFEAEVDQLDGSFANAGFRLQAKVFKPKAEDGFSFLRWGGLDVTTGYTWAQTVLTLRDTYEADSDLENGYVLQTFSRGTLEITQTAHTLPFELSTNLTLFELLTLYGGGAIDIPLGDTRARFDLNSDLVGEGNGQSLDAGTATIEVDEAVGANTIIPRLFVGTQLNFWALRVFAQFMFIPGEATVGLSAGVRVVL